MKKALFISADNFEDSELLVPYYRLQEAGIAVEVASMQAGTIKGLHGYEVKVTKTLSEVNSDDYDLLVLPGGKAPEKVRQESRALEIVRSFFQHNKPVAAICHGPQILISAGLMDGRRATCFSEVAPELKQTGATYDNKEVVIDGNLITSREPGDLPVFMSEIMKKLHAAGMSLAA